MEKKRLIIISAIAVFVVLVLIVVGILIFNYYKEKNNVKVFDIEGIQKEATPYENLFVIQCDNASKVVAGDEITCNVSINSNLQDYSIMDDVLEYISFDYDLGKFLSLEDVSIKSPYHDNTYSQFVLDTSEDKKVVLKNNNRHDFHKNVVCDDNTESCHLYGRTAFNSSNNSKKDIYDDSISNLIFQFKIKVSKKAKYSDVLKIRVHNLYYYSCMYGKTEEDDVKNIYKMDEGVYEFSANKLLDVNSVNKNNKLLKDYKVMYQVKVSSPEAVSVYIHYNKDIIGGKLESGKVVDVIGDAVGSLKNKKSSKFVFENYKNNYYYFVRFDDKAGYVKYSDVEIVPDSIRLDSVQENRKYYVYNDEYLYNGPGLYAQDNKVMIPKGTIVNSNIYHVDGDAHWLYVDYQGNKGWLSESRPIPYVNVVYGSANRIEDKKGSITVGENTSLFKYALSNEKIMDLPNNLSLSYDYVTYDSNSSNYDVIYYHVVYNGVEGWVKS